VATSSLTAFSYEGILFALKSWNGSLVIVQAGLVANPEIPGHLFHCGYTANVYRVVESVVQLYTAGKFEELAELHIQLVRLLFVRGGIRCLFLSPALLSD